MSSVPPKPALTAHPQSCWVLTADAAGMRNQGLGLAEALARRVEGLEVAAKTVELKQPWRELAPWIAPRNLKILDSTSDTLAEPWPDVVIGVGRQSIVPGQALKRLKPDLKLIQLQRLTAWPLGEKVYDLVIPPSHDRVADQPNVETSLGALNRITAGTLENAPKQFEQQISALNPLRYAVLVGGTSKTHQMTGQAATDLCARLKALVAATDCSLMITTSRRTGEKAERLLREAFDLSPHWFWDGTGENPYFAFLATADAVILTNDSVSMASEAASTGKPLYLFDLPGDSPKFQRFHDSLRNHGASHPLPTAPDGPLAIHSYPPLLEADRLAQLVIDRFAWG